MRGLNGSGGVFSAPLQHCYWSVEVRFLDSHHLIAAFSRLQSLEADFNILECQDVPWLTISSFLTVLFNKRGSGFSPHYPQNPEKVAAGIESMRLAPLPKTTCRGRISPDLDLVRL